MGKVKTFEFVAQPVIDGLMVMGEKKYSVAIKKTNGNILLDNGNIKSKGSCPIIFVRGIISFFKSLLLNCKMAFYSAEYFDTEENDEGDTAILSKGEWENRQSKNKEKNLQGWLAFLGVLFLILTATIGFFLVPIFISNLFFDNVRDENWILFNVVECISRLVLLIGYFGIFKACGGLVKKIRQYNMAANKVINCLDINQELSLSSVKYQYEFHPCNNVYVFFLAVIIASIALIFIKMNGLMLALLIRMLVIVLSIGIAYEIAKFFGKFAKKVAMIFGMWIEKFVMDTPDDMQIYVVIAAFKNAVFEE